MLKIKKFWLILMVLIVCALVIPRNKKILKLYYNEYLVSHVYQSASKYEKFVIAMEPENGEHFTPPVFLKQLLNKAFADYDVVYDNNASNPNLIVRDKWISHKDAGLRGNVIVPYMTISGEPDSLGVIKYKPYGFPFAELVSATPRNERELYLPFIGWGEIKIIQPRPNNFHTAKKSVLYVSSNCIASREKLFALLKKSKVLTADALGSCSNTDHAKVPGTYNGDALKQAYSQYQFVFAMENCQKPGYITEKIVNAFNSGAIPIYWGDNPTVEKLFNKDAFVNVGDFKTLEEAAAYIEELSQNNVRMQAMHDAPLFKDNIKNDLLQLDSVDNPYIIEQATKLRVLYDKFLERHKTIQKNK